MTGEVSLPQDFNPLQMLENFESFAKFALNETKVVPQEKPVRKAINISTTVIPKNSRIFTGHQCGRERHRWVDCVAGLAGICVHSGGTADEQTHSFRERIAVAA